MRDFGDRRSLPVGMALLFISTLLLMALPAALGCGGGGSSSQIKDLIKRAAQAGGGIDSYRMSLSMFFETGQSGNMRTDELTIEIDGNDVSLKETFYDPQTGKGTVIQETVRVGGRQYSRDLKSGQWVEEEPSSLEEAAATYTSHISDFVSYSTSAEIIGEETVNGAGSTHLLFQLSPQDVKGLLPSTPQPNLDANTGGQVDLWLDRDTAYPVKYDMFFRNVLVGQEFGNADVRIIIDITDINKPLGIKSPS